MKYIKRFEDKEIIDNVDYSDISFFIREEIRLGNVKPFYVENNLYKSGDYICSSFKIDNRDIIISSIVINDGDTICVESGRSYKKLSDCLLQWGIETNKYLYIGFGEYSGGKYNYDQNVNDNATLFRKMSTIIDIIKTMVSYHGVSYIILNSIENDTSSGLSVPYKKRDKFYELFLTYHDIKYHKIKSKIDINGEIIDNFYLLDLNY
jgi:signal peptidase I